MGVGEPLDDGARGGGSQDAGIGRKDRIKKGGGLNFSRVQMITELKSRGFFPPLSLFVNGDMGWLWLLRSIKL